MEELHKKNCHHLQVSFCLEAGRIDIAFKIIFVFYVFNPYFCNTGCFPDLSKRLAL